MPTNPRPDDPAEGSRETVDRQLKRVESKDPPNQKGDREHGKGSESSGDDVAR